MATAAHTEAPLKYRRSLSSYLMPGLASILLLLLAVWLVVNFIQGPAYFFTIFFIGHPMLMSSPSKPISRMSFAARA